MANELIIGIVGLGVGVVIGFIVGRKRTPLDSSASNGVKPSLDS